MSIILDVSYIVHHKIEYPTKRYEPTGIEAAANLVFYRKEEKS